MEVSSKKQAGSDNTTTSVHCDPCLLLIRSTRADYYCVDCDEFFCGNCCSVHKMSKLSRNHKLLTGDEIPTQKLTVEEENICSKHNGKMLEYYCLVHKNFFCTLCVTQEHKNCSIEYINDIATGFETSSEYRILTEKIASLLQQLKGLKQLSTRNCQDLQIVYSKFVSDIQSFRSEINNLLDSMETCILKEAQDVKEFDMKAAQTVSTACDTVTTDVGEILSNLQIYKSYKQQRQLVISAKKAETQICEFEKKMADLSSQNIIRKYIFHKNQKLLNSLQCMCSLGILVDREKEREKTEMEIKEKGNKDPESIRASYVGQINIKHTEDKYECMISGSVMIDPYRIALTDCHNFCVKLVDVVSKSIVSYLQFSTGPWDITCTDKSQLVVTCYNKLVFVDVGPSLTVNKELQLTGVCKGIIFNDNQLFVSLLAPEPAVELISLHGKILKRFSLNQYMKPLYICLSNSKSTLFVSDKNTNTVTSFDLEGRVQNIYRSINLKTSHGLTVDRYDNIYISGHNSHNIHQISTECRPIQILLDQTEGMEGPQSLSCCKTENRLYISHYVESKQNVLSVYELQ